MGILNLNWVAIFAAAIAGMLIGVAWYSPLLFGKAWLKALGKTSEEPTGLLATGSRCCGWRKASATQAGISGI